MRSPIPVSARSQLRWVALTLLLGHGLAACAPAVRGNASHGHHEEHAEAPPAETPREEAAAAHAHDTHPEPRPIATAERVVDPARIIAAGYPREAANYALAKEIPQVLDGLRCHCDCDKRSGHYSLLTCYENGHAIRCETCLGEAELAHKLYKEGKSLQEIRAQVDAAYRV